MIPSILVIEDDKDINEYLKDFLTENDFNVYTTDKGVAGLEYFKNHEPDLVLLDLGLPDMSGESVCAEMYKIFPDIPVIVLTAKTDTQDKVKLFNVGADDYITKPFEVEELLARIKARLRAKVPGENKLKIGDLELDPKKFEVKRGGNEIKLTPQEFKLLEYLMNNEGIVLSRDMILNRIWGYSADVESRVVDVYFGYLRKKIDNKYPKKLLHSVRGFGYSAHQ
ncbi:MAG TPA: response regulator transcription factor [Patescibacteria group bacterium]|nr:response regulator transcription factor [Patescibacteria group bacterium]